MSRRGLVKRYAEGESTPQVHPEEVAFHQAILDNPSDHNNMLVYADWLDEHGKPATAEMVRRTVADFRKSESLGRVRHSILNSGQNNRVRISYSVPLEYATSFPDSHHDFIIAQVPVGENHHLRLDPWVTRRDSKRLYPQLISEGLNPELEYPEDASYSVNFDTDTNDYSGQPPSQINLSRSRRGLVRYATKRPFTVPVGKITAPKVPPSLHGSRLAVVLHEIRDRIGRHDPQLRQLAKAALEGARQDGNGDIFTQIRDRLLSFAPGGTTEVMGGDPNSPNPRAEFGTRAQELARGYNWHRVSNGLRLDTLVGEYVNKIAKDHLKQRGEQYRAAHNLFGIGWEKRAQPVDARTRQAFLTGLQQHIASSEHPWAKKLKAGDVSEGALLRSLRRLGESEARLDRIKRSANPPRVSAENPAGPAWTGAGPTKARGQVRVSPTARAGQYRRRGLIARYGVVDFLKGIAGHRTPAVTQQGIHFGSHNDRGKYDIDNHMGMIAEMNAMRHALHGLGLIPPKRPGEGRDEYDATVAKVVGHFIRKVSEFYRNNPNDPLARDYAEAVSRFVSPEEGDPRVRKGERIDLNETPLGILDLSTAVTPMARHIAKGLGLNPKPEFKRPPYEVVDDGNDLLASHGEMTDADLETPTVTDPWNDFRLPSGFVELPKELQTPTGRPARRKPFGTPDTRRAIYQTIADHHEQGWMNEKPLVDTIVEKHGATPEEAKVHIGNFRRVKNKPQPPQEGLGKRGYSRSRRLLIRMGRAPYDEVHSIAKNQREHGGPFDPNNHSDLILADKLDDYGDSLATLVRRDMSYRGPKGASDSDNNAVFTRNLQDHLDNLSGAGSPMPENADNYFTFPMGPDGHDLMLGGYGDDGQGNHLVYSVSWSPHPAIYCAAMTPKEAIHLLDEHGINHYLKEPWGQGDESEEPDPDDYPDGPTGGGVWTGDPDEDRGRYSRSRRSLVQYARPINAVQPGETAHQALTRILGNRQQRRLGRNSQVYRLDNGDIAVRLHNTNVVTAHQNGQVTMNHGGYMTPTTRRFISGYTGHGISFAGGRFSVRARNPHTGEWEDHDYENNTRFPPYSDEAGFTTAIHENPHESTHRLAYADWLDEQGRHDEATDQRNHAEWLREAYPTHGPSDAPEQMGRSRRSLVRYAIKVDKPGGKVRSERSEQPREVGYTPGMRPPEEVGGHFVIPIDLNEPTPEDDDDAGLYQLPEKIPGAGPWTPPQEQVATPEQPKPSKPPREFSKHPELWEQASRLAEPHVERFTKFVGGKSPFAEKWQEDHRNHLITHIARAIQSHMQYGTDNSVYSGMVPTANGVKRIKIKIRGRGKKPGDFRDTTRLSRRGLVRKYGMGATEEDFHRMLDENPNDHNTRLVFADWLQDRSDPRADGYRALGKLQLHPALGSIAFWGHSGTPNLVGVDQSRFAHAFLPTDWFQLVETQPINTSDAWKWIRGGRRGADDSAALAFSRLPPERQQQIMNEATEPTQPPDDTSGEGPSSPAEGSHYARMNRRNPRRYAAPYSQQDPPPEGWGYVETYTPGGNPDHDRRLWVLNHEGLYNAWLDSGGDPNEGDPLEDGFVENNREMIDQIRGIGPDHYSRKHSRRTLSLKRYEAYRAPSGGMIVRGTHYKGGEMIPDMEGEFMNPPKFDPKKLDRAKRRLRARKITYKPGMDDSCSGTPC